MDALLSVNWIALLVLIIALLLFKVLNKLAYKINWTFVILISMVMGAVLGIVFASENNSYMTWLTLIGDIYVNLITALVAPVILVSVISGLIQLNDKEKMKRIGTKSVFWLLVSSAIAIVVTIVFGMQHRLERERKQCLPTLQESPVQHLTHIRKWGHLLIRSF